MSTKLLELPVHGCTAEILSKANRIHQLVKMDWFKALLNADEIKLTAVGDNQTGVWFSWLLFLSDLVDGVNELSPEDLEVKTKINFVKGTASSLFQFTFEPRSGLDEYATVFMDFDLITDYDPVFGTHSFNDVSKIVDLNFCVSHIEEFEDVNIHIAASGYLRPLLIELGIEYSFYPFFEEFAKSRLMGHKFKLIDQLRNSAQCTAV